MQFYSNIQLFSEQSQRDHFGKDVQCQRFIQILYLINTKQVSGSLLISRCIFSDA